MKPNLRPLKSRILAKQIIETAKEETGSGILLTPFEQKDKPTNRLNVLRVGKDVEEIKEGDELIWDGRATRIEYEGETYVVTEEKNGIAIVEQPTYE